jgi:hypothetical protein
MIFWGLERGLSLGRFSSHSSPVACQPCRAATVFSSVPTESHPSIGSVLPLNRPKLYKLQMHRGRAAKTDDPRTVL